MYQADLLKDLDSSEGVRELLWTTGLALRATKQTTCSIGHLMAVLVGMERHMWLKMVKMVTAGPAVTGWGAILEGLGILTSSLAHKLPEIKIVFQVLPPRPEELPCVGIDRQHISSLLYKFTLPFQLMQQILGSKQSATFKGIQMWEQTSCKGGAEAWGIV